MKYRVGIVDDHPALILGIAGLINSQQDMYVTGFGTTVADLIKLRTSFDVILLDLSLADNTTPLMNISKLKSLNAPIIAYTSAERPRLVREASRAGVAGLVRKSDGADELIGAIRVVAQGGIIASPDWAAAIDADVEFVNAQLTKREQEVLSLYAAGETAERVAKELYISRETVLDHIRRIRKKYASVERPAPTKVELFKRAAEDGIVGSAI